ncbi:MAG: hypothetical protein KAG61_03920 [Bacteriovoracaceae bacterium]|nr:hypothetical protein [Bacteriovoracaceae bacterium]
MPSSGKELIISDAQVFVFLILSETFEKVFSQDRITVYVPTGVVEEIKTGLISRKYPDVKKQFCDTLYNKSNGLIDLQELTIDSVVDDNVMKYYFELEKACFLDDGEREGVVLALQHKIPFLSDDDEAIEECVEQDILNTYFIDYIELLKNESIVTQDEYNKIIEEMQK